MAYNYNYERITTSGLHMTYVGDAGPQTFKCLLEHAVDVDYQNSLSEKPVVIELRQLKKKYLGQHRSARHCSELEPLNQGMRPFVLHQISSAHRNHSCCTLFLSLVPRLEHKHRHRSRRRLRLKRLYVKVDGRRRHARRRREKHAQVLFHAASDTALEALTQHIRGVLGSARKAKSPLRRRSSRCT